MALSDPGGVIASPLTIIDRLDDEQAIKTIIAYVNQHQVRQIVVGLPRSMDGSLGMQAEKVKEFVQELCRHTEAQVTLRDERLTTVAAKRLQHTVQSKRPRKKIRDDAAAAAIILQGYLDEGH